MKIRNAGAIVLVASLLFSFQGFADEQNKRDWVSPDERKVDEEGLSLSKGSLTLQVRKPAIDGLEVQGIGYAPLEATAGLGVKRDCIIVLSAIVNERMLDDYKRVYSKPRNPARQQPDNYLEKLSVTRWDDDGLEFVFFEVMRVAPDGQNTLYTAYPLSPIYEATLIVRDPADGTAINLFAAAGFEDKKSRAALRESIEKATWKHTRSGEISIPTAEDEDATRVTEKDDEAADQNGASD